MTVRSTKVPYRHIIYIYARAISIVVCLLILSFGNAKAQTVVANRVNAAASSLPKGCRIVAKYSDNKLHCVYYIGNNRLYKYDVLTDRNSDVRFTTDAYSSIIKTYVTENGKYIFVCVDKETKEKTAEENNQELWRITPEHNTCKKIGIGFSIKKADDMFIISEYEEEKTGSSTRKTGSSARETGSSTARETNSSARETKHKAVKKRYFSLDGESKLLLQT